MPVLIPQHGVLRPAGVLIVTDPDLPHEVHQDALQCCHCQRVLVYRKGSGRHLGRCDRCNAPTCDAERCVTKCEPIDKRLELYEAGKTTVL